MIFRFLLPFVPGGVYNKNILLYLLPVFRGLAVGSRTEGTAGNMKTMQEVQTMVADLKELYADVRLLDEAAIDRIREGERSDPYAEELCYACRHKNRRCRHCTVKSAYLHRDTRSKLEYFAPDIVQVTARYLDVEGTPYVLEVLQRMHSETIIDPDDADALFSAISGYNTKLYHDALTDVFNRRYYEEIVRGMTGPVGVALLDLDDFKVYNDTYGHHAGDLALKTTANVVQGCIRQTDALIRFGGDEFLLILPGIPEDYLKVKLEQIREKLHEAIVPGYAHMRLSVSVGGMVQGSANEMDRVVRQVDRLMYQAKLHKNTVVVAGRNITAPESSPRQEKQQILIVDDSEMNRRILSEILKNDYRIVEAANGAECLEKLHQHSGDIALVLLDLVMPGMDGFEVLDYMNRNHIIEDLPVIMTSSEDSEESVRRAYEMGVSGYVSRPFDSWVVYRRVFNTIKLYAKQRRLISLVTSQTREKEKNTQMMVSILSEVVEFRNGESGLHVQHIGTLTQRLLERLTQKTDKYDLPPEKQELIVLASALHDIGKIAIDDKILNKPGRLTQEEFNIMKTHTVIGANMLDKLGIYRSEALVRTAYEICRWHHERWDGRGYPDGLSGDRIPISAQVVSMADVYDALVSKRVYKAAYAPDIAVQMILHGDCGTFNPLLLECLVEIQDVLKEDVTEAE